jgi:hypothetical protein
MFITVSSSRGPVKETLHMADQTNDTENKISAEDRELQQRQQNETGQQGLGGQPLGQNQSAEQGQSAGTEATSQGGSSEYGSQGGQGSLSGQPTGGNDSDTGSGTPLSEGAPGTESEGGQSSMGHASGGQASEGGGFVGSQSGNDSDEYLRQDEEGSSSQNFAEQGRGATEDDGESDGRSGSSANDTGKGSSF